MPPCARFPCPGGVPFGRDLGDDRNQAIVVKCQLSILCEWTSAGSGRSGCIDRHRNGALTLPLAGTPAEPAAALLTINEKHGSVRRDGRCGNVDLVLAPGMVVDANELSVRHSKLAISRNAGDNTSETLHVRLAGRMKHGRIDTRWLAPRR